MRARGAGEVAAALLGLALGALFASWRLAIRRAEATPPPHPRRPVSMAVERVEAPPPSRPIRRCARCGKTIWKKREGEEIWIRIEEPEVHYLHEACADERGNPLPPAALG